LAIHLGGAVMGMDEVNVELKIIEEAEEEDKAEAMVVNLLLLC